MSENHHFQTEQGWQPCYPSYGMGIAFGANVQGCGYTAKKVMWNSSKQYFVFLSIWTQ